MRNDHEDRVMALAFAVAVALCNPDAFDIECDALGIYNDVSNDIADARGTTLHRAGW